MKSHPVSRRSFHKIATSSALSLSAVSAARVYGANEKVHVGFIGVGNRGSQLLDAFVQLPAVQIAGLCDIDQAYLDRADQRFKGQVKTFTDFRTLIASKDIDAVAIATPDHWHAIQTISACRAGKDVYCEKPLSITIREGRRMVEVARETHRIVQVGTHRRSSGLYRDLSRDIQAGKIGKVSVCRAYRLSNMSPTGIGKAAPGNAPARLDWDTWLGPRPARKFQATIAPYKFRWHHLYSSQMANWGVHYLDAIRWMTGDEAPSAVVAVGGNYVLDDDRTIPDTLETIFEFSSGRLAIFGQYEASGTSAFARNAEIELRGTNGTLFVNEKSYEIVPEIGGQFQTRQAKMAPVTVQARDGDLTVQHAQNFIDCVKSRALPNADVEIGHRSTTMSLLANIALATKMRLEWDAKTETVTNVPAANDMLHYEYRKPWKLD